MIDPATAIMAASTAFNAIRKGCQIGRDLEGMAGDLGRWSKAISDFDFAAKRVENPKWYQSFGSVEQQGDGSVCAEEAAREYARRAAQDD